jgi:hypothetical protein
MALGRAYSLGCAFIAGWFVMTSGSTVTNEATVGQAVASTLQRTYRDRK